MTFPYLYRVILCTCSIALFVVVSEVQMSRETILGRFGFKIEAFRTEIA